MNFLFASNSKMVFILNMRNNDDEEIERMEKIFKKVPLKKPSIFKEIIEKLNEKTKNK